MFLVQHACRQRLFRVVPQHRHGSLNDDRPVVEILGNEMHCAPVYPYAVVQCPRVGIEPAIGRQQRGMDIDQFALIPGYEIHAQDAHKSGKRDNIRIVCIDRSGQRVIETFAVGMVAMRND